MVLREKGCPNATTAHRLLYRSVPRKDGTFYHIPKRPLDKKYDLIVVDEVSMLPKELWDLLLSHYIHVIALGDPGQLPPVSGLDNGVLSRPHIFLEEVMRQAQDSEIIRLSMDIRDNKPLQCFLGDEVQVINPYQLTEAMYLWADQILVGKNITRHRVNSGMRQKILQANTMEPIVNDRVICLHNDWDFVNEMGDPLINGLTGTLTNVKIAHDVPFIKDIVYADFLPDDANDERAVFKNVKMDYKLFYNHEPTITKENFRKIPSAVHPEQFDYGYCITVHKSQGSEFDKILVLEEFLRGDEHARWLYTACTRAKKQLILVRNFR